MGQTKQRSGNYQRISDDRHMTEAGVNRQLEDNRATAERLGIEVAAEYTDNDKSAFNGKDRPAWTQMLADAAEGAFDVIIAWHDDRLWRDVTEQQLVFAMCADVGVTHIIAGGRTYDTSSADDNFISGIQALVAQKESADKSRRLKRKHQELAKAGKVANGGPRPFGFEEDRVTIKKDEAKLIQEAVDRYLAGESMQAIISNWQDRGVKTTQGNDWRTTTFRRVLYSARIAGLRAHKGEVVADAEWAGIISRSEHERLRKRIDSRSKNLGRTPRTYLLSGMIRCGKCDTNLVSRRTTRGKRQYCCQKSVDGDGCGRLAVIGHYVEDTVRDVIIAALSGDGLAKAIEAASEDDTEQQELILQLVADQEALEELTGDYYVRKLLDRSSFIGARQALEERIEMTKRALQSRSNVALLTSLPSTSRALREAWDEHADEDDPSFGLTWRRALVEAVLDYVVVLPSTPGGNTFDPDRVDPHWRV